MAGSPRRGSSSCPVCWEESSGEAGKVRFRLPPGSGTWAGEAPAGSRWMGGPVRRCCAPGGGRSHDLPSGLPTCCLLRRPLPGPAPASGCSGTPPHGVRVGTPRATCLLTPSAQPGAWGLPPTPRVWLRDPLAHLSMSLSLCFLISETATDRGCCADCVPSQRLAPPTPTLPRVLVERWKVPGERTIRSGHACVPPLPVGLGWRGLGSPGLASETAHQAVPGHLPWHLGKAGAGGGGGQCRMSEPWRQWASVAPRGRGSSSVASRLRSQEI